MVKKKWGSKKRGVQKKVGVQNKVGVQKICTLLHTFTMQSMRVCPLLLHTRPHIPSYAWVWYKMWPFIPPIYVQITLLFTFRMQCIQVCAPPPLSLYFRAPLHWYPQESSSCFLGGGGSLLNGRKNFVHFFSPSLCKVCGYAPSTSILVHTYLRMPEYDLNCGLSYPFLYANYTASHISYAKYAGMPPPPYPLLSSTSTLVRTCTL